MLNRSSRFLISSLALALFTTWASGSALVACEYCRLTGTTAFHVPLGGDDAKDARAALDEPDENTGGATTQFVTGGGQWLQPGGPGSPVTLTYSYQNMFDGGLKMPNGLPLPTDLIRRSIEEALGLWAGVAPLHFVEVPDNGRPYGDPFAAFGQIRFRHVYINGPDIPGQPPTTKAQAYFPGVGVQAGDVEFDNGDPWQEVGALSIPDILGATVHEVGHSLGLLHTDLQFNYLENNQAVMFWVFRRFAGPGTGQLHADDIAGIRAIYGAGVGSVTPLPIPEPGALLLMLVIIALSATGRDPTRRRRCA